MGNEKMPYDSLERFRVGSDPGLLHDRYDHARVGSLGGKTAIPADDAADFRTNFPGVLQGGNQIRTNILFLVPSTDGKHKKHIVFSEIAGLEPFHEHTRPAVIIGAGGE